MRQVSFLFTEKVLDEEFFALDALIARAAEATDGYLGKDSWVSTDGARRNSVYYWRDDTALGQFASHPDHLEAKRRYAEWYGGFQVVVAEVRKSYGDGGFAHVTPDARAARRAMAAGGGAP